MTARFGASAFLGAEHDSLGWGCYPFGVVEREGFAVIEDRQVVVRVAGHANHVGHRYQGASAGPGFSAGGFEVFECGGHDDRHGQPVVLAQLAGGNQSPQAGEQSVVGALGLRAVIATHRILVGSRIHHGGLVVGVACPGGGQFGQHRLDRGPQLLGHQSAHA